MKDKLILILTALLIIVITISIFLNKKQGLQTTPLPRQNTAVEERQIAYEPQAKLQQEQGPLPRRAITIIETPRKEKRDSPVMPDAESVKEGVRGSSSSQSSSSQPGKEEAATQSPSGITIINKEPTAVEKNQMSSKGIMIQ
ncbi:MAG: hypothetical protein FJZ08_05205 [Candidatus Omnitrophica bacterium]|nr:hypothetical protein [Candidatus Omnitrophota bacterium]